MITLEELIKKYKIFDLSDTEIIKEYFIQNHIEDAGVKLLSELAESKIKYLYDKNSYAKEHLIYCRGILDNQNLTFEDRKKLFELVTSFTYYRDLNENELQEAKRIFDTGKVLICPIYFVEYLKKNNLLKDNTSVDYAEDMLNDVIKRRDN